MAEAFSQEFLSSQTTTVSLNDTQTASTCEVL